MEAEIICGECLGVMRGMETGSVDLVFTSPPYEAARRYGAIDFQLRGQEWVDWAFERYLECLRVSRGLVAWVVEGQTSNFENSCTPYLLIADLKRAGVRLRKPPIFARSGVMGSGGPDWLRNDYETIVCASHGRLPWSDNTAMGEPPKYKPGGNPSNHTKNGRTKSREYKPPAIANPGNIIKGSVGKGHMGSNLAHENEAPFPEWLAEFFVRSFCPPGGIVLDCFGGSGTTMAVAEKHGRNSINIELRDSQVGLMRRRLRAIRATVAP